MPEFNNPDKPISEQFRIVAKQFNELDTAAKLLEECKTATLSQMIQNEIKHAEEHEEGLTLPHNKAEMRVKASDDWKEYVYQMVKARSEANLKKIQLDYIRMQFTEWQMNMASARDERKMMRGHA